MTHPAARAITQAAPEVQLATVQMASQPSGVRVILLCPLNQPDNIELVLRGNAEIIVPEPTDRNPVLTAFSSGLVALAPGSYGLAPCACCGDARWRVALPVVVFDGWEGRLVAIARALGHDILTNSDSYCLQDLQALMGMTGR